MNNLDVIRAWKDEEYRQGLSEAERAMLPAHPAGLIELTEEDLADVNGGVTIVVLTVFVAQAGFWAGWAISSKLC